MTPRVVLITGSTSGIGLATARRFAEMGDTVVFNSAHSVEEGEHLASVTPNSHYVQADISNTDDCDRLIREVLERCGRLDVLINNAGTTRVIAHQDLEAATVDVWREIFEVNVFGTWQLSVAAMPALRLTHGAIVNVTSVAGVRATGSSIPYAASKAALNHVTTLLAKVVGPEVRVNAVAPGLIET
ncbi:MAG: SDR family oxidoreductase, partial [Acidimicrobiales bacterium]